MALRCAPRTVSPPAREMSRHKEVARLLSPPPFHPFPLAASGTAILNPRSSIQLSSAKYHSNPLRLGFGCFFLINSGQAELAAPCSVLHPLRQLFQPLSPPLPPTSRRFTEGLMEKYSWRSWRSEHLTRGRVVTLRAAGASLEEQREAYRCHRSHKRAEILVAILF